MDFMWKKVKTDWFILCYRVWFQRLDMSFCMHLAFQQACMPFIEMKMVIPELPEVTVENLQSISISESENGVKTPSKL